MKDLREKRHFHGSSVSEIRAWSHFTSGLVAREIPAVIPRPLPSDEGTP